LVFFEKFITQWRGDSHKKKDGAVHHTI